MEQVGYRLIRDADGTIAQEWGGVRGFVPGVPNPVILPDGSQVCGWTPGDSMHGHTLHAWTVEPDLATIKAEMKSSIGVDAETARLKYITAGSGKAMSYRETAAEAVRFLATGGHGDYPFLAARVASGRYSDLSTAAAATRQIEAQWAFICAKIDEVEDRAKVLIDAATTVEQAVAAAEVVWP